MLYHVICGAFKNQKNADRQVSKLTREGLNSNIYERIGGLHHVSIGDFRTRPPAVKLLREQRNGGKKVWILKKSSK